MIKFVLIPISIILLVGVLYYAYLIIKQRNNNRKEWIKALDNIIKSKSISNGNSIFVSEYQYKHIKHVLNSKGMYCGFKIELI